jgi:hypothetical protein
MTARRWSRVLEKATQRTGQTTGFRLPVQRVSRPGEGFRGYQGTVAGGSIKPGDSVVVLPSGVEANVKAIVTYDLVRNAAVSGDAITLVLDRPVDVARGDMIAAIDQRPQTGRAFTARLVALSPDGIVPGKRYWLKAGARRQRVMVRPTSALDLATGNWDDATFLPVNGIGVVELDFEDTAIFDTYETNRETGAFILIDPESLNTVAGGMIESKRSKSGRFDALPDADRATFTLPARLLEAFLKTDFARSHAGEIRVTGPGGGVRWKMIEYTDGKTTLTFPRCHASCTLRTPLIHLMCPASFQRTTQAGVRQDHIRSTNSHASFHRQIPRNASHDQNLPSWPDGPDRGNWKCFTSVRPYRRRHGRWFPERTDAPDLRLGSCCCHGGGRLVGRSAGQPGDLDSANHLSPGHGFRGSARSCRYSRALYRNRYCAFAALFWAFLLPSWSVLRSPLPPFSSRSSRFSMAMPTAPNFQKQPIHLPMQSAS